MKFRKFNDFSVKFKKYKFRSLQMEKLKMQCFSSFRFRDKFIDKTADKKGF